MSSRLSHLNLLRFAGLFTWACCAIPLLMILFYQQGEVNLTRYGLWWVAHLTFGLCYWLLVRRMGDPHASGPRILLLLIMTLAALAVSYLSQSGLGGILLLINAGVMPWLLPFGLGAGWLLAQNLAMVPVLAALPETELSTALLMSALYLGYSSFTFVTSLVALRQARARDQLRRVNSELRATQALLAESSRIAERVRISRELHDLVGHHLTALSLNLEVATHLVKGQALEHVTQAHAVAKLLLSDVREVVSNMRTDDEVNLKDALQSLTEGVPEPDIHMDLPDQLAIEDPQRAQVLLRCVQEIITNTVRHADAENLWISFERSGSGVEIKARDDGRGAKEIYAGNGLKGMRERLDQLGGKLAFESGLGKGFALEAWLPLNEPAPQN